MMGFVSLIFWLTFWALLIAVVWAVFQYNKLQGAMQTIREAWSNLQAGMKKRLDLANQIIDIASGYGEHEKLTHVTLSNNIEGAIDRVAALAQNYPQLRANETYQQLMGQLESLEESILARRENYNSRVRAYNTMRNAFPTVLIAGKLKFDVVPYFEIDDAESLEKVKLFARDDSQALRAALDQGGNTVKRKLQQAKEQIAGHLDKLQENNEETVNAPHEDIEKERDA